MATEIRFNCWSCNEEIVLYNKVTRNDDCPKCDTPLKCCYNCRFYDKDAHHQCVEPQAEWVRYKEKANLCSYFVPRSNVPTAAPAIKQSNSKTSGKKNGRKRANSVENNSGQPVRDRRKAAWDALFKDGE